MRALAESVVVGGVVHPAGTVATDELEALIPGRYWGDTQAPASAGPSAEELAEVRQLAAAEIASRDERIVELEAEVERLTEELAEASKSGPAPEPVDYLAKSGPELKAEITARNADRDPAGEAYIRVEPPGNKPEMAAALTADDQRAAGTES